MIEKLRASAAGKSGRKKTKKENQIIMAVTWLKQAQKRKKGDKGIDKT